MCFQPFQSQAYTIKEEDDLLDAIDDFISSSIVLPPGNFERKMLLPLLEQAQKKHEDKKKKFSVCRVI